MFIIYSILLFFVLVILHELGHFLFAKIFWIKVYEFGVWIPPRLFTFFKDKSWTAYTFNALPAWGFVRVKWEDVSDPETFKQKDSLFTKPFVKQAWFLMWWILVNVLTAYILFVIVFSNWTKPINILPENAMGIENTSLLLPTFANLQKQGFVSWSLLNSPAIIEQVLPWKLASQIWILSWDKILSLNNTNVNNLNIRTQLQQNLWKKVDFDIDRNWIILKLSWTCPADECLLWVAIWSSWDVDILPIKYSLLDSLVVAKNELVAQTNLSFYALKNLWKKIFSFDKQQLQKASENLASPVASVKIGQMILTNFSWIEFLAFAWIISLWLAIFNLLPIPALDWGRLLSIAIQKLFRFNPMRYYQKEALINNIIFLSLMILWVYMMIRDFRIFWWWKI